MSVDRSRLWLNDGQNFTGYSQVLEEYEGNSASSVALKTTFTLGDDVISQSNAAGTRHLLYDGHGSTRTLTDAVGAVTDTFHYDAYGVDLAPNRTDDKKFGPVNQASTSLRYSGEWVDDHMQQQYLRARWYNPANAVFNRLDDYAGRGKHPQSLHKYAYCHGDPTNGIDPSGNATLVELVIVQGIQLVLAGMILQAVGNYATGGALNESFALAIHYLFMKGTWIAATTNLIRGLATLVTDVGAIAQFIISLAGNILTGGITGIIENVFGAIGFAGKFGGIVGSGMSLDAVAQFLAMTVATILICVVIGVIIAGIMKLASVIIRKVAAAFKRRHPVGRVQHVTSTADADDIMAQQRLESEGHTVFTREADVPGRSNLSRGQLDELGGLSGTDEVIEFDIFDDDYVFRNEFGDIEIAAPVDLTNRNAIRFPVPD